MGLISLNFCFLFVMAHESCNTDAVNCAHLAMTYSKQVKCEVYLSPIPFVKFYLNMKLFKKRKIINRY